MIHYVAGFLMSRHHVLLVQKKKPVQLAGKWNGIGGKVEPGEDLLSAMYREFLEETRMQITKWQSFCKLVGNYALDGDGVDRRFSVDFFYSMVDYTRLYDAPFENDVGELLGVFAFEQIHPALVLPNVTWLLPMARSFACGERASSFAVEERYA